jgi:MFS transporter, DHA1 family, tetracycline resistance protein
MAEFGTRAPFYAAAALAALNLVFGLLVMPETLPARLRRPFRLARANPFGAFLSVGRLPGVGRLLTMFFLYQVAFMVYPAVWAFFATARFGWEPRMIGLSLAAFGDRDGAGAGRAHPGDPAGSGRTQHRALRARLQRLRLPRPRPRDKRDGGADPHAAHRARRSGDPALQGIMSRTAPDDAQGELQGVISSTASLAMVVSPLIMTQVFAAFTAPGAGLFMPGRPSSSRCS